MIESPLQLYWSIIQEIYIKTQSAATQGDLMKLNPPKESVMDRFLRYVKIDTQSQDDVEDYPSTRKQFDLLRPLVDELKALGVADAAVDKFGYVTATIPSNLSTEEAEGVATIGFIAHVDTSPAISGKDVKPISIVVLD